MGGRNAERPSDDGQRIEYPVVKRPVTPPPEPHDVRAHLLGGVPVAEVTDKRPLFDSLGFKPAHAFAERKNDPAYFDFSPALPDRAAIRPLVENDPGVQACLVKVRQQLATWWKERSPRLADLPKRRDLNRVRTDFLDTFVTAMLAGNGLVPLDRFKLAGVIGGGRSRERMAEAVVMIRAAGQAPPPTPEPDGETIYDTANGYLVTGAKVVMRFETSGLLTYL